jgi:hypothetical protein
MQKYTPPAMTKVATKTLKAIQTTGRLRNQLTIEFYYSVLLRFRPRPKGLVAATNCIRL